jgi:pimeloyl-ACP methyl ester carboxylesterase
MHFEHDGLRFEVWDAGPREGVPVILLHGFPQNRDCWKNVIPLLTSEGYRVLAPNQRGYSSSARPRGRRAYRMERLTADIVALADSIGARRFHVVGHDWGGAVAWALAARHPDRVHTMTSLATPHPQAMAKAVRSSDQALRSWYVALFQLPWVPELALRRPASVAFQRALVRSGLDENDARDYVSRLGEPGAATAALNWYRALPFATKVDRGASTVPTLYVHGSDDFALGQRAAELTGEHVDGAYHFVSAQDQGHWLPERAPELVAGLFMEHARSSHLGVGEPRSNSSAQ